jgi:hypothetical protein
VQRQKLKASQGRGNLTNLKKRKKVERERRGRRKRRGGRRKKGREIK